MDAGSILAEIARLLDDCGLEAVLIGNAAAALQGAPVTTTDFDFLFRKTPVNLWKLKAFARCRCRGPAAFLPGIRPVSRSTR
jgi:hypothetical protein